MSYRKGANFERKVKKTFEEKGYTVIRSAGSHGQDLFISDLGLSIQCKALKNFSAYRLMEGADALIVKANYRKPLIVLSLERFLQIAGRKRG